MTDDSASSTPSASTASEARDAAAAASEEESREEAALREAILSKARLALRDLFGFEDFRPAQVPFVEAILRNENVLVVMPTGGGKSLLYQLPALARRGLTLVVSPLKSLMKDQVDKLRELGLGEFVAFINSEQSLEQQSAVIDRIRGLAEPEAYGEDTLRLLYVAPERFSSRTFMDALYRLPEPIRMLAVDEAHCISQWGHDFRPHYTRLASVIEKLKPRQVVGFTATATPQVQADIREQLGQNMHIEVHGFRRDNLFFEVKPAIRKRDKIRAIEEVYHAMGRFGIVYCATRANVERTYEALRDVGIRAGCYHGGMEDAQRVHEQEKFLTGQLDVMVATNAFGLGVDKPDVRFIVHYDIPGTVEAYYQEAGRAGRDGEPSRCVLLYSQRDLEVQRIFLEGDNPRPEAYREVWEKLLDFPGEVIEQTRAEMAEGLTYVQDTNGVSTIIKRLEEAGLVQRLTDHRAKAAFRLVGSARFQPGSQRAAMYRYLEEMPNSRTSGVMLDPEELAEAVGVAPEKLGNLIRALQDRGVLQYEPPFRGRALRVVPRDPEDAEQLELDWEFLLTKRDAAFAKLDQMVEYAETSRCRHRYLLEYFGDPSACDCGEVCDVCTGTASPSGRRRGSAASGGVAAELSEQAIEVVWDILGLAKKLRGVFGSRRITQILIGSREAKIQEWKLDRHREYGKHSSLTAETLNRAVDTLLSAGLLELYRKNPQDKHQRCRISERGEEVLARKSADVLPRVSELAALAGGQAAAEAAAAEAAAQTQTQPAATTDSRASVPTSVRNSSEEPASPEPDEELYQALRRWRGEVAERFDFPAFRVAANETLRNIAAWQPTTREALAEMKRIGPRTLDAYGEDILRIVRAHRGEHESSPTQDTDTEHSSNASPADGATATEELTPAGATPPPPEEPSEDAQPSEPGLDEEAAGRLAALKRWRQEEARRRDTPPHEIAWDDLLERIASANPLTLGSLEAIDGVAAGWLNRYGRDILTCLRVHRATATTQRSPRRANLFDGGQEA